MGNGNKFIFLMYIILSRWVETYGNYETRHVFCFPPHRDGNQALVYLSSAGRREPVKGGIKRSDNFYEFTIEPSEFFKLTLPKTEVVPEAEGHSNAALQIQAEYDIIAYGYQSEEGKTVESFFILPVSTLGTEYFIVTDGSDGQSVNSLSSYFSITATDDGTECDIKYESGNLDSLIHQNPSTDQISLSQYETFSDVGVDFTGTHITCNKAVAVMAAHECLKGASGYCDNIVEMMIPVTSWGTMHFVNAFLHNNAQTKIRILAAEDGTSVTYGTTDITLQSTTFSEKNVNEFTTISSTKDVLVTQIITDCDGDPCMGDPSMVTIPSLDMALPTPVHFIAFGLADIPNAQSISVFCKYCGGNLLLDGSEVQWEKVEEISGGEVWFLETTVTSGSHVLDSNDDNVMVAGIVYGIGPYISYAHTTPILHHPAPPPPEPELTTETPSTEDLYTTANLNMQTQNFVLDTQPPIVSKCPEDVIEAACGSVEITWEEPTAEGSIKVTKNYVPGQSFEPGVSTVIYTFQDEWKNKAYCQFNVIIANGVCQRNSSSIPFILSTLLFLSTTAAGVSYIFYGKLKGSKKLSVDHADPEIESEQPEKQ